jgi:hypothetical protein
MTAIRNVTTGEWIVGGPSKESAEFVRLVEASVSGTHRAEQIIHIQSIVRIEEGTFGYYVHMLGQREPVTLDAYEYYELLDLMADRTVTLGSSEHDV